MPEKITEISTDELFKDLEETVKDIEICKLARAMGVETYGDNESVDERIRINGEIQIRIEAELLRRHSET